MRGRLGTDRGGCVGEARPAYAGAIHPERAHTFTVLQTTAADKAAGDSGGVVNELEIELETGGTAFFRWVCVIEDKLH